MHWKIAIRQGKRAGEGVLTSGLDLKLEIAFVLVQRSTGQAASGATYPPAALYNDNIGACKRIATNSLFLPFLSVFSIHINK